MYSSRWAALNERVKMHHILVRNVFLTDQTNFYVPPIHFRPSSYKPVPTPYHLAQNTYWRKQETPHGYATSLSDSSTVIANEDFEVSPYGTSHHQATSTPRVLETTEVEEPEQNLQIFPVADEDALEHVSSSPTPLPLESDCTYQEQTTESEESNSSTSAIVQDAVLVAEQRPPSPSPTKRRHNLATTSPRFEKMTLRSSARLTRKDEAIIVELRETGEDWKMVQSKFRKMTGKYVTIATMQMRLLRKRKRGSIS
jgi:hypothetical protein